MLLDIFKFLLNIRLKKKGDTRFNRQLCDPLTYPPRILYGLCGWTYLFCPLTCFDFFRDCMGYVLPNVHPSANDPFDVQWTCNFCSIIADPNRIELSLAHVGKDMAAMNRRDPKHCRMFLDHYVSTDTLHPNHYYFTEIRLNLAQLYGQLEGEPLNELSQEQLNHKRELCLKVLKIAEVIFPG